MNTLCAVSFLHASSFCCYLFSFPFSQCYFWLRVTQCYYFYIFPSDFNQAHISFRFQLGSLKRCIFLPLFSSVKDVYIPSFVFQGTLHLTQTISSFLHFSYSAQTRYMYIQWFFEVRIYGTIYNSKIFESKYISHYENEKQFQAQAIPIITGPTHKKEVQLQSISYLVHCICLKKLGLLSTIVSMLLLFIIGPQTLFLQFFSYTSVHYVNEGQCHPVHIFRFIKCQGSTGKKDSAHIFRFIPIVLSQIGQFMVSSVICIYCGGFRFDFIPVQY